MKEFIGEPLLQVVFDTSSLAAGEPGAPISFVWRGNEHLVTEVLRRWKGLSPDRTHGSGEMYVEKHWFHILTNTGKNMEIYFDRSASRNAQRYGSRWWLYTVED
jgi:hypothetical protein